MRTCAKNSMDIYINPINSPFDGSEFHHLHVNDNHTLGIFIPKKLHKGVYHNSATGHNMRKINKLALEWIANESQINGDMFNPELKPYTHKTEYTAVSPQIKELIANERKLYGIGSSDSVIRTWKNESDMYRLWQSGYFDDPKKRKVSKSKYTIKKSKKQSD
jgi:hypothetical protein